MDNVSTALVGFIGVALGAVIQFVLDRRSIRETRSVEMKSDAYAAYLRAVSAIAHKAENSMSSLAAAKSQICAFGDAEVILALQNFEASSQRLDDPVAQKKFLALVSIIRAHSIADKAVDELRIRDILLGFDNRSA
ncbi:MAG: hypothetical protein AB7I48_26710 [Planctomycetaceae bacterium]